MTVPAHSLNPSQRLWYARMVVAAILADGQIDVAEVEFIKQVISIIEDPKSKTAILKLIETKQAPPIEPPPQSTPDQLLAAIYLELVLICLADSDFNSDERFFLKQVATSLEFTDSYIKKVELWLEEGLDWKQKQMSLLPANSGLHMGEVPLKEFNAAQKLWYAQLMVATILLDKNLDDFEVQFLKMAISFVEAKADKITLMRHVKNRIAPSIEPPPKFTQNQLIQIMFSVIQVISADEAISYAEQTYLRELFETCSLPAPVHQALFSWCQQGVQWKSSKNALIHWVRRKNA